MPIRNTIKKINNGIVGVIDWNDTPEEFIKKLKNVEFSVVTKISKNTLLLSIDYEDINAIKEYNFRNYTPPENELKSTSIFIKDGLTQKEEDHLSHIIKILIDNGSIKGSGVNLKVHTNGKTFVNFSHSSENDRNLVKAFINHLCD